MTARNPTSPMCADEIKRALRRAAEVCIEKEFIGWSALDVCRADATADAAGEYAGCDEHFAYTPEQAATFLLLVGEAL